MAKSGLKGRGEVLGGIAVAVLHFRLLFCFVFFFLASLLHRQVAEKAFALLLKNVIWGMHFVLSLLLATFHAQ